MNDRPILLGRVELDGLAMLQGAAPDPLEAARAEIRLLRGVLEVVKEDLHVKNEVRVWSTAVGSSCLGFRHALREDLRLHLASSATRVPIFERARVGGGCQTAGSPSRSELHRPCTHFGETAGGEDPQRGGAVVAPPRNRVAAVTLDRTFDPCRARFMVRACLCTIQSWRVEACMTSCAVTWHATT